MIFGFSAYYKIKFPRLGYQYEQPLSKKWLLNVGTNFGVNAIGSMVKAIEVSEEILVFGGDLYINTRYYYNRTQRMQKGLTLIRNTGNFLGIGVSYNYNYTFYNGELANFSGAVVRIPELFWGGRSNLGGQFFIDYSVGVSVLYSEYFILKADVPLIKFGTNWQVCPKVVINFGYVFK